MRLIFALAPLIALGCGLGCGLAVAQEVPLPRPRPPIWAVPHSFAEAAAAAGPNFDAAAMTSAPTDCDKRLAGIASTVALPRLIGPGECGGPDMVRLEAVLMPDKSRVAIKPSAVLRCEMAESVSSWVRDEAGPRVAKLGSALTLDRELRFFRMPRPQPRVRSQAFRTRQG